MQRMMFRSKIHRARLTGTELDYEGSITIDPDLLEAADMLPGEKVQVLNLNTGARFETYTIAGPRGSGCMMLNGPAARLGHVGDKVIVIAYAVVPEEEAREFKPLVLQVDESNRPRA